LTQGEFSFEIRLAEGRPLRQTDRVLTQIEESVGRYPEIEVVYSSVGGSADNQFARNTLQENLGQLYVVMKDKRDTEQEKRTIAKIRDELKDYPEITYKFNRPTLFSIRTPVEVEIFSYNLTNLRLASELVRDRISQVPGLNDVKTSVRPGDPEIHVRFDRSRLARLGLSESEISNVLRNKIRGDVATRFREDDKQIDILVRAQEEDRRTVANLKSLSINVPASTDTQAMNAGGTDAESDRRSQNVVPIRLDSVADISLDRGPSEIRRIRSQRAALVSANLSGRDLNTVSEEIRVQLQDLQGELPLNTTVSLAGQREEVEASYKSLFFAFSLAVFLVYLVMASQFESLIHPFIIIFCVPLAVVGVIFSLFLTGTTLSVMVFLGVIVLAGIVVNNAIILIDYTNQLRAKGATKREALLQAGQVRLRPIVMTTLTTVLGLIPMALGWGEGAEVRAPMAISVMGGLLFSTLLTLVFIPVVYEWVDRKVFASDVGLITEETEQKSSSLEDGLQPS
jgi:HAE1 family hydrophobic/amphiphilic exporter-1